MKPEIIKALTDAGFSVYMRKGSGLDATYAYFTDGVNIGYVQETRFTGDVDISTVNVPDRTNGAGYGVLQEVPLEKLDAATLKRAFSAPDWAVTKKGDQLAKKWPDMAAFIEHNSWGGGLHLVAEPVKAE